MRRRDDWSFPWQLNSTQWIFLCNWTSVKSVLNCTHKITHNFSYVSVHEQMKDLLRHRDFTFRRNRCEIQYTIYVEKFPLDMKSVRHKRGSRSGVKNFNTHVNDFIQEQFQCKPKFALYKVSFRWLEWNLIFESTTMKGKFLAKKVCLLVHDWISLESWKIFTHFLS